MKIGVISLGCPKNLVDTENVMGLLNLSGAEFTGDIENADIILINTCGFIDAAKEESINTILEAVQLKETDKKKKIIVTGCLVERYKEELEREIPEVDMFIDLKNEFNIPELIGLKKKNVENPYINRVITTPRHTAYIKISEGCDHTCSFCAIPNIRGKHRSRSIESIVEEAKFLANTGVRELNIVSQDTSFYGVDIYGKPMLWKLIDELEKVEGIDWIRLYYLYPTTVDEDFIKAIRDSEKVVRYFEMPIQHSEDRILKDMMRGYRKRRIEKILEWKEKHIPDAAIRTSVIVGFPTEREEDFIALKEFIRNSEFDWLGVFTYSHEEGTPAYSKFEDVIPEEEKIRRINEIVEIQEEITERKNRELIGKEVEVLIDGFSQEWETLPVGRTYRSAYEIDGVVYVETTEPLNPGTFVRVKIKDVMDRYDLIGEAV